MSAGSSAARVPEQLIYCDECRSPYGEHALRCPTCGTVNPSPAREPTAAPAGPPSWCDEALRERIEAHPEWQRQAHETPAQYRERMRTLRRTLEGSVVRRMRARSTHRMPRCTQAELDARVGAALEHYEERMAVLEVEGVDPALAQRQALEDVLRVALGALG